MPTFKDYFSKQADVYARYRPHYPEELFVFLAGLTKKHNLVWDCGTGNGQAAVGIAAFYDRVIATDPSSAQVSNAPAHPKVEYRVEKGETSSLASHSADLITLGNALHWMDFDVFYAECRRVLKPGGIIAAWAYALPVISPEADALIKEYHHSTLGTYWLPENRLVQDEYINLPFPFEEISAPVFYCSKLMRLEDITGYLNTWSATQRFIDTNALNPTDELKKRLEKVWGMEHEKLVRWKLIVKIGRP